MDAIYVLPGAYAGVELGKTEVCCHESEKIRETKVVGVSLRYAVCGFRRLCAFVPKSPCFGV